MFHDGCVAAWNSEYATCARERSSSGPTSIDSLPVGAL